MEMDNYSGFSMDDEQIDLPPGFRFHPTDEELITHYLAPKVLDSTFNSIAIGEADFNKIEPWELPRQAKMDGKEWYFFCVRDRKYPTGLRTNRATDAGYWKATGKDKEIFKGITLVGMKKTLVFYTGRAPKGEKTNWVMHEYRLEGKYAEKYYDPKNVKNEWVISRVFEKSSAGKKQDDQGFLNIDELQPVGLPPLMESSPYSSETRATSSHVTCFSNPDLGVEDQHNNATTTMQEHDFVCSSSYYDSKPSLSNMIIDQDMAEYQFDDSVFAQEESMLKLLLEGKDSNMNLNSNPKAELSHENGLSGGGHDINAYVSSAALNSPAPIEFDGFWNYY